MSKKLNATTEALCLVDHQKYNLAQGLFLRDLDHHLRRLIQKDYPHATANDFICGEHLIHYRLVAMAQILQNDAKQNQKIKHRMDRVMASEHYQITDVNEELAQSLTFGQKVADAVAHFGGSWPFIIAFVGVMLLWMIINILHLFGFHFDPYPFILLNLFLSMVAAIQAPLIMMSQNRAAEHDRLQAKNDFKVNSKSEEEIRVLHSKIDHLIQEDIPAILEIQRSQTQMIADLEAQLSQLNQKQPYV